MNSAIFPDGKESPQLAFIYNLTPCEQECPEERDLPPAIQMSTVARVRPFQSWKRVGINGMKIKEASFKMEFGSPMRELS